MTGRPRKKDGIVKLGNSQSISLSLQSYSLWLSFYEPSNEASTASFERLFHSLINLTVKMYYRLVDLKSDFHIGMSNEGLLVCHMHTKLVT